MTSASDEQIVTPGEARSELSRILASPEFVSSQQLTSFLEFIVAESIAGRADNLKERTVARRALGRGDDFDPRLDCVVRVVAGKLRRTLDRYYALEGASDALCIEVPKGSYCPVFRRRSESAREPDDGSPARQACDAAAETPPSPIVAVVPLKLLTEGPRERFLAELLADDVAVRLGRLPALEVIDCLAVRPPWNRAGDLRDAAQRLHASFVFGGTVTRVGSNVRFTVRLIDSHSGILAWGDQYDRQIDDGPLAQQDDVANRITMGIADFFGLS
jgi:TolB-like protein